MAEIISFATGKPTKAKIRKPTRDADVALRNARGKLTSVVILGWSEDEGTLYVDHTTVATDTAIFMCEAFKHGIFEDVGPDDDK